MSDFKVGDRVIVTLRASDPCREFHGRTGTIYRTDDEGGFIVRFGSVNDNGADSLRTVASELTLVTNDDINHPDHYTAHPTGVECIQITEHMGFNLGNAVKYIWRSDLKGNDLEDLRKAEWYIRREIVRRESR